MDDGSRKLLEDCFLRPITDSRSTQSDCHSSESSSSHHSTLKTELQLLRLSDEAQQLIMNTLKFIHGDEFKLNDNIKKFKTHNGRLKKFYWEDRGNLIVQSISSNLSTSSTKPKQQNGTIEDAKNEDTTEDRLRNYAVLKLQSYGFAKEHCVEALDYCKGDIDETLKLLWSKYFTKFHLSQQQATTTDPDPHINDDGSNEDSNVNYTENELLQMREDEKEVLQSIYDKSFEEKDKNSVWSLKLQIDYLLQYSLTESKKLQMKNEKFNLQQQQQQQNEKRKKPKCKNILRGFCKFGDKCRFSHEIDENPSSKTDDGNDDEMKEFYLEIRFTRTSRYPYEAPLIFLKTNCHDIPSNVILKINYKLYTEALKLCNDDGMPCIYTISEYLKIPENIIDYLSNNNNNDNNDNFPDPNKSLFYIENDGTNQKSSTNENENDTLLLPSHYKKGTINFINAYNLTLQQILNDDLNLSKKFIDKRLNINYENILKIRKNLPIFNYMNDILMAVNSNQIIIICGETGCGKSTQVPQFILDDWLLKLATNNDNDTNNCHHLQQQQQHIEIICTQPRRLSAIGVAERVAYERNECIGNTIGYQIRLENKLSKSTRLTFCTIGILLQKLNTDPYLNSITHIIIDEVHERSLYSDFLLMILKNILTKRKNLKIILMSATINAELFSNYFNCIPIINIPGKIYPVEQLFLEDILDKINYTLETDSQYCRKLNNNKKKSNDYDDFENELEIADVKVHQCPSNNIKDESLNLAALSARYSGYSSRTCKNLYLMDPMKINPELIENVLNYIVNASDENNWPMKGTILIFLPGFTEIQSVYETLCDSLTFNPRNNKYIILPLHSSLSNEEQSKIFDKVPNNKRRIILSTNIAETSITIDDCVFVIDCGLMKEKQFDSNRNMESLELVWESKANAKQRKGRAGRIMSGICIHLFTSNRYQYQFKNQQVPEILRVPLEQLILKIKTLSNFKGCNLLDVTGQIIEPPTEYSVTSALSRLKNVGATDDNYELTALGKHLSVLPVDVRIGKLMLFGAIFQCLDSVLTIAACLSHKSPFLSPFNKRMLAEQKKRSFSIHNSDHLTILNAYRKWNEVNKKSKYSGRCYANENFLSWKTLESISEVKYQFLELLVLIDFVPIDLPRKRKNMNDCILELTGDEFNCNGNNNRLLISLLCAALYPNIVKILIPEKYYVMTSGGAIPQELKSIDIKFKTLEDGFVTIHPSSVLSNCNNFSTSFLIYQEKLKTYKIYIKECSIINIMSLLLFSGSDIDIQLNNNDILILLNNDWIILKSQTLQIAQMIYYIKNELLKLLEEKIQDPLLNLLNHKNGKKIISTIIYLISKE